MVSLYSYKIHTSDETIFLEDESARVWSYIDGTRTMEEIVEDSGIASLVVLTTLKTLEKKGLIYWKDRY